MLMQIGLDLMNEQDQPSCNRIAPYIVANMYDLSVIEMCGAIAFGGELQEADQQLAIFLALLTHIQFVPTGGAVAFFYGFVDGTVPRDIFGRIIAYFISPVAAQFVFEFLLGFIGCRFGFVFAIEDIFAFLAIGLELCAGMQSIGPAAAIVRVPFIDVIIHRRLISALGLLIDIAVQIGIIDLLRPLLDLWIIAQIVFWLFLDFI